MRSLHIAALVLAVIGAINWGLVGLFQVDLVAQLFGGQDSPISRVVYTLVGLAGVALIATSATLFSDRRLGTSDFSHGHSAMR